MAKKASWKLLPNGYTSGLINGYSTSDQDPDRRVYELSQEGLNYWKTNGFSGVLNPWAFGYYGSNGPEIARRRYSRLTRKQGDFIIIDNNGNKKWITDEDLRSLDPNTISRLLMVNSRDIPNHLLETIEYEDPKVQELNKYLKILKPDKLISQLSILALKKIPIPLEVRLYLSHVSNGIPFFTLPDGVTNDQFLDALRSLFEQQSELLNLEMPIYEDILKQSSTLDKPNDDKIIQSSTNEQDADLNQINNYQNKLNIHNNDKLIESNLLKTYSNKKAWLYTYPVIRKNLYSIHPDIYSKIINKLIQNKNNTENKSNIESHILSINPLLKIKPGELINDSAYYFIGKNGEIHSYIRYASENPNIVSPGDIIRTKYSNGYVKELNGSVLKSKSEDYNRSADGKTNIYFDLDYPNKNIFDILINKMKHPSIPLKYDTLYPGLDFYKINRNYLDKSNVNNNISYLTDQQNNELSNLQNQGIYYHAVDEPGYSFRSVKDIINLFPADRFSNVESEQPLKKGAKELIKSFFGFKQGGKFNYLNYMK